MYMLGVHLPKNVKNIVIFSVIHFRILSLWILNLSDVLLAKKKLVIKSSLTYTLVGRHLPAAEELP